MKRNICFKSASRQPVQTLVLLLLVGAITFAFVSRAVEYLVVNRETDRLAGYYRSVGSLDVVTPGADVSQAVELVSKSQYVAFEERRRYCSGVLQGVYNADVDGNFSADFLRSDVVFYGKVVSKNYLPRTKNYHVEEYQFTFAVDKVLVGYPEYVREGGDVNLGYFPGRTGLDIYVPENLDELRTAYDSFEIGQRYLVRARFDPDCQELYQILRRDSSATVLTIQPLVQGGIWAREVEPGSYLDLADPALSGLPRELAVLEENQHAMSVYSTADMSAMPLAQEASRFLYLTEGRWLDSDDNFGGRRVCAVHNDFAVRRGLSVGDTITLELRNLKNPNVGIISTGSSENPVHHGKLVHLGYITPREDWDGWQGYETHIEELEIVGVYGILWPHQQPTTFSTEMYIPDSCMPAGYCSGKDIDLSLYSFVLDSPEHEKAFLDENRQALKELGMQATFVETGWNNFRATSVPLKRSLAINVWVFSAVLVPAMALAAFLYLWQRRKDFAILRSMGVPKGSAVRQLAWSMGAVGAAGVVGGGTLSWGYALAKAAKTLASLQGPKAAELSVALSPAWLAGLCIVAIAALSSFTVAGAVAMSRRPVLELLQGTESRAIRKRKPAAGVENTGGGDLRLEKAVVPEGDIAPMPEEALAPREPRLALSVGYVLRHIRRAPSKSILTVMVALGFTLALGWLGWSIQRNEAKLEEFYRATQVEAEIVKTNPSIISGSWGGGFIPSEKIRAVMETGFVKDAYIVASARAAKVGPFTGGGQSVRDHTRTASRVPLLGFNQAEQFFSEHELGENRAVEYAEGWDESLFSKDWVLDLSRGQLPVVLPVDLMARLGLELGGEVWLNNTDSTHSMNCAVAGQYEGMGFGYEAPIMLPVSLLEAFELETLRFSVARFTLYPERNRELPHFRAKVKEIFDAGDGKNDIKDVTLIVWDGQMTQVAEPMEKNLQLITILHRVTLVLSALIAAGLGALMVFQSAKEAAIMRVLGVTKHTARSMLCGEQALLCVVGLTLGLGFFAAIRGQVSAASIGSALGCATLYLVGCLVGSWQGARLVTNRAPLELLQVKE